MARIARRRSRASRVAQRELPSRLLREDLEGDACFETLRKSSPLSRFWISFTRSLGVSVSPKSEVRFRDSEFGSWHLALGSFALAHSSVKRLSVKLLFVRLDTMCAWNIAKMI